MTTAISRRSRTDNCRHPIARSCGVSNDRSGMLLRTHFQPGTTIIQVLGAIEACNAARLSGYVDDLASAGRSLILDLRGVDFCSSDGLRALVEIVEKSQRSGMPCVLVTSEAVDRLLAVAERDHRPPTAASVEDALQQVTPHNHACSLAQRVTPPEVTRC